jgi:hypothetical protein
MDDLPERRQRLKSKVFINACTDLPLAVFFRLVPWPQSGWTSA